MPGRESAFAPAGRKPSKSDTTNVMLQARTNPHDLKYQALVKWQRVFLLLRLHSK